MKEKDLRRNGKLSKLYSILEMDTNDSFELYDPSKKAVYHKENFSAFLEGRDLEIQPVTVEIVPSLECNFNCANCTYVQNKSKAKDLDKLRLMSQHTFDSIIDGLSKMRTKSIIFTGGGEPTINPNYLDFIKQASKEKYKVGFYTNGSLLEDEEIEQLLEMGPEFTRVSLNAGTAETHRNMHRYNQRGSNLFEKVTENIVKLGKKKKESKSETTIGISFIISEKNYSELDKISNLLLRLYEKSKEGIDYAAFRPEVYYFDTNLNPVDEQPNTEIFSEISDKLEEKIGEKIRPFGMDIIINKEGFEYLSNSNKSKPNIATSWSASFDYDGGFYITSEHNGSPGFSMGNVKEKSILEIWNDEKREELLEKMSKGEIETLPYFKLKRLNDLLWKIRDIGTFSTKEVDEFYKNLGIDEIPPHANFI